MVETVDDDSLNTDNNPTSPSLSENRNAQWQLLASARCRLCSVDVYTEAVSKIVSYQYKIQNFTKEGQNITNMVVYIREHIKPIVGNSILSVTLASSQMTLFFFQQLADADKGHSPVRQAGYDKDHPTFQLNRIKSF